MNAMEHRKKIAVIIRLFNRVTDAAENIALIRRTWTRHDYQIIVVANGVAAGHTLLADARRDCMYIELGENAGHIAGNAQLLKAGAKAIPADCDFTVILESDTWLMDDLLIDKYIGKLNAAADRVWASANWVDKYHSFAVDFALIKTPFLRANPGLFDFAPEVTAECGIYNFLRDKRLTGLQIKELYPTHSPRALPWGPEVYFRRRCAFPLGPMVTHHIEHVAGGIERKKIIANRTAGKMVFAAGDDGPVPLALHRALLIAWQYLLIFVPKSRWATGRRIKNGRFP